MYGWAFHIEYKSISNFSGKYLGYIYWTHALLVEKLQAILPDEVNMGTQFSIFRVV